MLPTHDQIALEAYNRWIRRDRAHGYDRNDWLGAENELTFLLNYKTVVEYPLQSERPLIVDADEPRRCRFCERSVIHVPFSEPRPVVQAAGDTSLFSAEICDECEADCREPLASHSYKLWNTLSAGVGSHQNLPRETNLIAAFKSLIISALFVMPMSELDYCSDTLEWVSNPDFEYDGNVLTGSFCRVYFVPSLSGAGWINLSRRVDDEAAMPYLLVFVGWRRIVIQVPIPLCIRDQDLDGKDVRVPERSPALGPVPEFQQTGLVVVRTAVR
jgi:hypothetical protein